MRYAWLATGRRSLAGFAATRKNTDNSRQRNLLLRLSLNIVATTKQVSTRVLQEYGTEKSRRSIRGLHAAYSRSDECRQSFATEFTSVDPGFARPCSPKINKCPADWTAIADCPDAEIATKARKRAQKETGERGHGRACGTVDLTMVRFVASAQEPFLLCPLAFFRGDR